MRAEFDWLGEILKAAFVIAAFVLLMTWIVGAQDEVFAKDCKATGFYRAGDTVIECKVLAEQEESP